MSVIVQLELTGHRTMRIQATPRQLENQHVARNIVNSCKQRLRRNSAATSSNAPAAKNNSNGCWVKNEPPQRIKSIESSAETTASQDDYGADVDTTGKGTNGSGNQIETSVEHDDFYAHVQSVEIDQDVNEGGKCSLEDCYQYEILLWLGCSLGGVEFAFADAVGGYPYLKAVDGNESLPGMWNIRAGDFLIAVNGKSTHNSAMSYESVMHIVSSGARPAVLRFRRPSLNELRCIPRLKRRVPNQERLGRRRNRERLEKSLTYVIWREEDGPLGISLKKQRGSQYPAVADMNRSSLVRGRANVGDLLISINQHDISKLGKMRWVQLLEAAPKPLVLTFRLLCFPPHRNGARTLDL